MVMAKLEPPTDFRTVDPKGANVRVRGEPISPMIGDPTPPDGEVIGNVFSKPSRNGRDVLRIIGVRIVARPEGQRNPRFEGFDILRFDVDE
jgi:hypothetical protein